MTTPNEREAIRVQEEARIRRNHAVQADIDIARGALESMFSDIAMTYPGEEGQQIQDLLFPSYTRARVALSRIEASAGVAGR